MSSAQNSIKHQIIEALAHQEAQDGLYFRNLFRLHSEDERQAVRGTEADIFDALKELIVDGKVAMQEAGEDTIFFLARD